ncbi:MAG: thioesterase [Clostridium sp.]|nr:thioesterase [Acetatifactor muris]MCM1526779.1 thioesterase [Bacteroides sp.]MCM1562761.1 thioesterase [Clostridium sp.]
MYFFDGRIRYSETDLEGRLTMASLIDYFQDCSTFHSEDLGLGVKYLADRHLVWVLSSWQIAVERYPALGERVKIGTAPYEFKGFLGSRNFVMLAEDGSYAAKANSLWCLLNTDTWKPASAPKEMLEGYEISPKLDMDYASRKIALPEGGNAGEPITVRKHHLDTNNHVNNGQYVDMAMEFLPEQFKIRQMRAEYKKQALLDDVLYPYVVRDADRQVVALNDEKGSPYAIIEFM